MRPSIDTVASTCPLRPDAVNVMLAAETPPGGARCCGRSSQPSSAPLPLNYAIVAAAGEKRSAQQQSLIFVTGNTFVSARAFAPGIVAHVSNNVVAGELQK